MAFEFRALCSIPPALGGLSARDREGEPKARFTLEIRPADDLELTASACFDVDLDVAGYPGRPPKVTCGALDHLPASARESRAVDPTGAVRLPILDAAADPNGWSRGYSAAVVFYALRRLFLLPAPDSWRWRPEPPRETRRIRSDKPCEPAAGRPDAVGRRRAAHFECIAGHGCDRGKRHSMEDVAYMRTRIRIPERRVTNAGLFIVFDGHGGRRCAEWAKEILPERLLGNLRDRGLTWREALWRAFVDTDAELRQECARNRDASGSTVLCALFDGTDRVYLASLGDCRAVLATRGGAVNLTTDCRADRPDEVARVVAARGFVANKRVNGQIAVSRALGDFAFKQPPGQPPAVSCEPDISEVQLRDGDDFLVLACDGLYDVCTSNEAASYARDRLRSGEPLDDAAKALVHHAIDDCDSRDNVTVVLVKFHSMAGSSGGVRGSLDDDADALLADLDDYARGSGGSTRHNGLDAAAGSPSPMAAAPLTNRTNRASAPPRNTHAEARSPAGRRGAGSKSEIIDDDDLMDFLMDDANFS